MLKCAGRVQHSVAWALRKASDSRASCSRNGVRGPPSAARPSEHARSESTTIKTTFMRACPALGTRSRSRLARARGGSRTAAEVDHVADLRVVTGIAQEV